LDWSEAMPYQNPSEDVSLTIANAAAQSDAVELAGRTVQAVEMPSAWTAAALTFLASRDGSTYVPLYIVTAPGSVTELSVPSASIGTAEARAFALDPAWFLGWSHLKVRSGINGAEVNQGASRTVRVKVRGI
jgi:hypothetical protein